MKTLNNLNDAAPGFYVIYEQPAQETGLDGPSLTYIGPFDSKWGAKAHAEESSSKCQGIAVVNSTDKPTHGGSRIRAGRRISDNPLRRYAVMLSDAQAEKAIRMGYDNMSKGIRKAIDEAKEPNLIPT